jgi:hypothetical protein
MIDKLFLLIDKLFLQLTLIGMRQGGSINPNWHETGWIYLLIIFESGFVS